MCAKVVGHFSESHFYVKKVKSTFFSCEKSENYSSGTSIFLESTKFILAADGNFASRAVN